MEDEEMLKNLDMLLDMALLSTTNEMFDIEQNLDDTLNLEIEKTEEDSGE